MNNNEFKKALSGVQPSSQAIERIMDMTEKKQRGFKITTSVIAVACLAIVATALFGNGAAGVMQNSKIVKNDPAKVIATANNFFTITAYASDENGEQTPIDLKKYEIAKTDVKISFEWQDKSTTGSDCAVNTHSETGFIVNGNNIKNVTYSSQNGSFSYSSTDAQSFDVAIVCGAYEDECIPYATELCITPNSSGETMEIYYNPEKAIDILLQTKDDDYTKLPSDRITITAEFLDGSVQSETIITYFDVDGNMLMEYCK